MTVQGTPWPALLEDLRRKREAITTMIDIVTNHFVGDAPGEMPASPSAVAPASPPKRRAGGRAAAAAIEANGHGPAILAMLKKHGGVMKPGELARAMKLEPATLRYQLKPLETSKQVFVTGVTAGRRISLPGAKEAP